MNFILCLRWHMRSCLTSSVQFRDFHRAKGQLFTIRILLKSIRDALTNVLTCVMRTLIKLQNHCTPLARCISIHSLSNELLSRVIEARYSPVEMVAFNDRFSLPVSHVNRHFRAVALNTPTIWPGVGNTAQPQWLELLLQSSKAAKLYIGINDNMAIYERPLQFTSTTSSTPLFHTLPIG